MLVAGEIFLRARGGVVPFAQDSPTTTTNAASSTARNRKRYSTKHVIILSTLGREESTMQTLQADYFSAYHNLTLTCDANGVLVAEFHTNGGPFTMTAQSHTARGITQLILDISAYFAP